MDLTSELVVFRKHFSTRENVYEIIPTGLACRQRICTICNWGKCSPQKFSTKIKLSRMCQNPKISTAPTQSPFSQGLRRQYEEFALKPRPSRFAVEDWEGQVRQRLILSQTRMKQSCFQYRGSCSGIRCVLMERSTPISG